MPVGLGRCHPYNLRGLRRKMNEQHKVTIRLGTNGKHTVEIASLYPTGFIARTFVPVDHKSDIEKVVAEALKGNQKSKENGVMPPWPLSTSPTSADVE